MKKSLLILSLLFSTLLLTGQTYKISGHILEKDGSKPVAGAIVLLKPGGINTYSGQTGAFTPTGKPGSKQIEVRILGYKPANIELELRSDTVVDLYL